MRVSASYGGKDRLLVKRGVAEEERERKKEIASHRGALDVARTSGIARACYV